MAYDQKLAERVRGILADEQGLTERKMFGGVAFMLNGNMCCGVLNREVILRLDPEEADRALRRKHTRAFDMTGRPMRGFVVLTEPGTARSDTLKRWLAQSDAVATALPPKTCAKRR